MSVQVRNDEAQSIIRADTPYPAMLLIAQVTRAAPGVINFTNIPQNFKHLQIIGYARSVRQNLLDYIGLRLATGGGAVDAGANYAYNMFEIKDVTPNYACSITATSLLGPLIDGASSNANAFTGFTGWLPGYANAYYKHGVWPANNVITDVSTANSYFHINASTWRNAGEITAIRVLGYMGGDNLDTGSSVSLYGVYG